MGLFLLKLYPYRENDSRQCTLYFDGDHPENTIIHEYMADTDLGEQITVEAQQQYIEKQMQIYFSSQEFWVIVDKKYNDSLDFIEFQDIDFKLVVTNDSTWKTYTPMAIETSSLVCPTNAKQIDDENGWLTFSILFGFVLVVFHF